MNIKFKFNIILVGVVAILLVGCGRKESTEFYFVTEPIPGSAIDRDWTGGADDEVVDTAMEVPVPLIANALAGVVQKVIGPADVGGFSAVVVGHAMPRGARVFDLQKCKEHEESFQKTVRSALGFELIHVEYRVSFLHGCQYQGKGKYLANVRITPLRVETEPLWSIQASTVSSQPVNAGTAQNPDAVLSFSTTFAASGIGSLSVTDEYNIKASSGELKVREQPF